MNNGERRPTQAGTHDGQLSEGGNWCWDTALNTWIIWHKDSRGNVAIIVDESKLSQETKDQLGITD